MEAFDEKFSRANLFTNVLANLRRTVRLRQQVFVSVADAQMRNMVVVGGHDQVDADFLHKHFRKDVLVVVRQVGAPGTRLQIGDPRQRRLHFFDGRIQCPRDLRDAPFAQRLHAFADNAVIDRVLFASPFQLQQQAFAQVAGADARRMKRLNDLQHFKDSFRPDVGREGKFIHAGLEVTVIVDIPDDHFRDLALVLHQIGCADLFQEVFLKRGARHQGVEHELPLFLILLVLAHRKVCLRKMVAPFLVELGQPLQFSLKIIYRRVAVLFRRRIEVHVRRRLGQVRWSGCRGFVCVPGFLLFLSHLRDLQLLQERVLLEFL